MVEELLNLKQVRIYQIVVFVSEVLEESGNFIDDKNI